MHVEHAIDGDETVRFAVEISRGLGIFSAKDIDSLQVVRIARDAGHAQRNPSLTVGPAEPAAISPDCIKIVVIRPGDGPQITPRRCLTVGRMIPNHFFNYRTWGVRRS